MPESPDQWLEKSAEQLVCRYCLRWMSLLGAEESDQQSVTVYVPDGQLLTPDSLRELALSRSREEWLYHDAT